MSKEGSGSTFIDQEELASSPLAIRTQEEQDYQESFKHIYPAFDFCLLAQNTESVLMQGFPFSFKS